MLITRRLKRKVLPRRADAMIKSRVFRGITPVTERLKVREIVRSALAKRENMVYLQVEKLPLNDENLREREGGLAVLAGIVVALKNFVSNG